MHDVRQLASVTAQGVRTLLLLLLLSHSVEPSNQKPGSASRIRTFFDSVDRNRDGQLEKSELEQFVGNDIGGSEPQSPLQLQAAAQQAIIRLDGSDVGTTVSQAELESYLHSVLKGTPVADWVAHGLGLPQYTGAFQAHAVNVLDFPLLIQDGGQMLDQQLGVQNQLHNARLLRAMQRLMLGLGQAPAAVPAISCSSGPHNSLSISWLTPSDPGNPPFHKFVLERLPLSAPGASWEFVADAVDVTRWLDAPPPGLYQYRVVAWNVYGRGTPTISSRCTVVAPDAAAEGKHTAAAGGSHAAGMHVLGLHHAGSAVSCSNAACSELPTQEPAAAQLPTKALAGQAKSHVQVGGVCPTSGGVCEEPTLQDACLEAQAAQRTPPRVKPETGRWFDQAGTHHQHLLGRQPLQHGNEGTAQQPQLWQSSGAAGGKHPRSDAGVPWGAPTAAAAAGPAAWPGNSSSPLQLVREAAVAATSGQLLWGVWNALLLLLLPACVQLLPLPGVRRLRARAYQLAAKAFEWGLCKVGHDAPVAPADSSVESASEELPARRSGTSSSSRGGHSQPEGQQPMNAPTSSTPPAADAGRADGLYRRSVSESDFVHVSAEQADQRRATRESAAAAEPAGDAGLPHSRSTGSMTRWTAEHNSPLGGEGAESSHRYGRATTDAVLGSVGLGRTAALPTKGATAAGEACQGSAKELAVASAAHLPQTVQQQQPQELYLPPLGPLGKHQCAHPGCAQRFDSLWNRGAKRQRHSCGRCLRSFCLEHTAYSTHGPTGDCGMQSRCVCAMCYAQFTPEYRQLLATRNTLASRDAATDGGSKPGSGSGSGSSASPVARLLHKKFGSARQLQEGGGSGSSAERHQEETEAVGASSSSAEVQVPVHGLLGGVGPGAAGLPPAVAGSRGRLNWARTWTKLHALQQFNRAGKSRQERDGL